MVHIHFLFSVISLPDSLWYKLSHLNINIVNGDLVVVVEPAHYERLEPGAVIRHCALLQGHHVLAVKVVDMRVQVHVLDTLDRSVLGRDARVFEERLLQVLGELGPHGERAQVAHVKLGREPLLGAPFVEPLCIDRAVLIDDQEDGAEEVRPIVQTACA